MVFSFSPSVNHHAGIGIILHSSLAMYVIRKQFYKDWLLSFFLQLPGRQDIFIIGNNKSISECHSTLVSCITAAFSAGAHVLLGGDLNAEFDCYLKNLSNPTISSPTHPLFRYLHLHQFEDLCAFDSLSPYLHLDLRVLNIYLVWIIFGLPLLFLLLIYGLTS
ncbi:hypothetical protein RhiirA1_401745 [Rhizophagus irregularis]|uniref:Uncharacterized protein n=1 Tax=Rhizophagus irregularis TaxID=588596 RepID=A0A2N0R102_9GLOM|nr:hypothetical protein RhiirA1_401745 [Rhizophagus irregularis]